MHGFCFVLPFFVRNPMGSSSSRTPTPDGDRGTKRDLFAGLRASKGGSKDRQGASKLKESSQASSSSTPKESKSRNAPHFQDASHKGKFAGFCHGTSGLLHSAFTAMFTTICWLVQSLVTALTEICRLGAVFLRKLFSASAAALTALCSFGAAFFRIFCGASVTAVTAIYRFIPVLSRKLCSASVTTVKKVCRYASLLSQKLFSACVSASTPISRFLLWFLDQTWAVCYQLSGFLRDGCIWFAKFFWNVKLPVLRRLYVHVVPEGIRQVFPDGDFGPALLFATLAMAAAAGFFHGSWKVNLSASAVALLVMFLIPRRPSRGSFDPVFKNWFAKEYFPNAMGAARVELQRKAWRDLSSFGRLRNSIMGVTEDTPDPSIDMSVSVWHEFWQRHSEITHVDLYVLRLVSVNLGTNSEPCRVTFSGMCNTWFRVPFIVDVNNVSLVIKHCCE